MIEFLNSFDEKNIDTIIHFCFLFFGFPIQYGLIIFLDQYNGNNCVDMHINLFFC